MKIIQWLCASLLFGVLCPLAMYGMTAKKLDELRNLPREFMSNPMSNPLRSCTGENSHIAFTTVELIPRLPVFDGWRSALKRSVSRQCAGSA